MTKTLLALVLLSLPAFCQFTNAKKLQGVPVSGTAPSDGQALCYDAASGQWKAAACSAPSGGGGVSYCAATSSGGSGVTWTCTASPAVAAYAAGVALDFVPDVASGASATVNANSLGAKSIKMADGSTSPPVGAFVAGQHYMLVYGGTNFVARGQSRSVPISFSGGGVALTSAASFCFDAGPAGLITGAQLVADVSGTITFDVLTVATASYTGLGSASSITAAATPALSSAIKQTPNVSTWTKGIALGTTVCGSISSPATLTTAVLTLTILGVN